MDEVLKTRALSGVIFGIIVTAMLLAGKWGVTALFVIVSIGGSYEYCKICKKSVLSTAIASTLSVSVFILIQCVTLPQWLNDALLYSTLICYAFFISNVVSGFRLNHSALLPFIALIYPIAALAMPIMYDYEIVWASHFWFWAILLIWISDTGAYLVGRKIGKTKLIETVSPKKTIEGSIGAGLFTILGGLLIGSWSSSFSLLFWVAVSITIWIIGTFGDLYESTVKRKYDVKDSGNLMPGHGGFLDRFDSLIFAAPFLVLILKLYKFTL
jgi:phosphatidate cytidylyltransferase